MGRAGDMITTDWRPVAPETQAGIGLRSPHVGEVMATRPVLAFLEVHAENYMGGGPALAALERPTGCGLLLDVNIVHVSCRNFDEDPDAYLAVLVVGAFGEVHLVVHAENEPRGRTSQVVDHVSAVADAVWLLYARALERFGV